MVQRYGDEAARELLREAGRIAGRELCLNLLDTRQPLNAFIADLQSALRELNIGVLRVKQADPENLVFMLTVSYGTENVNHPGSIFNAQSSSRLGSFQCAATLTHRLDNPGSLTPSQRFRRACHPGPVLGRCRPRQFPMQVATLTPTVA